MLEASVFPILAIQTIIAPHTSGAIVSVRVSVCVSEFVSFVSLAHDKVSVALGVPHVSVPDVRVYVLVCPCMSVHVKIIYICRIYVTT